MKSIKSDRNAAVFFINSFPFPGISFLQYVFYAEDKRFIASICKITYTCTRVPFFGIAFILVFISIKQKEDFIMIRLIIVAITVIGFLILSIPILLIEWIIGKFSPRTKEISSLRIIQGVFKFILWEAGTKVTIIGEENIPKDTPVLYIGNHRSYFDIVLSYSRCPLRTGYIAKKEMERYPLLSNWMRYLHCLFLDRKDIKQGLKTILTAIEKIKSGISICIFPEGTRNANADELELLPFHEGSFKIASKSGCAIIPMAMNNTAEIFEAHMPKIKSTHVVLEYGKPIYVKELSREDQKHLGVYTQNVIHEMLEKNQKLV